MSLVCIDTYLVLAMDPSTAEFLALTISSVVEAWFVFGTALPLRGKLIKGFHRMVGQFVSKVIGVEYRETQYMNSSSLGGALAGLGAGALGAGVAVGNAVDGVKDWNETRDEKKADKKNADSGFSGTSDDKKEKSDRHGNNQSDGDKAELDEAKDTKRRVQEGKDVVDRSRLSEPSEKDTSSDNGDGDKKLSEQGVTEPSDEGDKKLSEQGVTEPSDEGDKKLSEQGATG